MIPMLAKLTQNDLPNNRFVESKKYTQNTKKEIAMEDEERE